MPSKVSTITASDYTITSEGRKILLKPVNPSCRATCTTPRYDLLLDPNEPLALDVEFQEFLAKGADKWAHRMGRISLVNSRGETIYDTYVRYEYNPETKTKMPPPRFGFTRKDLWMRNGAKSRKEVEGHLREIFHNRVIVGHGMRLDKIAVGDVWNKDEEGNIRNDLIFDTQHIYGQVGLGPLVATQLPEVTFEWHTPTEDARMTMLLYLQLNPYEDRHNFKDAPYKGHKDTYDDDFPKLG